MSFTSPSYPAKLRENIGVINKEVRSITNLLLLFPIGLK